MRLLAIVLIVTSIVSSASAFTLVETLGGSRDSLYASGVVSDGEVVQGHWMLRTSAGSSDFQNDVLIPGAKGVTYVMMNDIQGSADSNDIRFSVTPVDNSIVDRITISQSPYPGNGGWNGADIENSQFRIFWTGNTKAEVHDPDGQLVGVSSDGTIESGTSLRFSEWIRNGEDTWQIDVTDSNVVRVDWSSSAPQADSSLTREWITFTPMVSPFVVPEPNSTGLLAIAFSVLLGMARRRK